MVFQRDARSLLEMLQIQSAANSASDPILAARLTQATEIFRAADALAANLFERPASPPSPIRDIPVE
jgi:hypothetical protein